LYLGSNERKNKYTPEQIVKKLREAEVLISKGETVAQVIKELAISDVTYYRWRKQYCGRKVDQAKRFKELEQENLRLKKLETDLSLDNAILKGVSRGNV